MRKNGMQKKNTQKKKMEQIKPTLNVQINLNLDLSLKFWCQLNKENGPTQNQFCFERTFKNLIIYLY